MRLAIADPPYLGRAEMWYGERSTAVMNSNASSRLSSPARKPDHHPDAAIWDDPATHRDLVAQLVAGYDGWVIAMVPDNLFEYLQWVPRSTRVAVWHDPNVMPNGSHPRRRWEAVLVHRAPGRRRVADVPMPVGDVLSKAHSGRFAGRKPRAWTEWVLTMLGYCDTHDTVDDLFAGSGAVSRALAQGRLLECRCP